MPSKKSFIAVTNEIVGVSYYNTSHVVKESLIMLSPWEKGKLRAEVTLLEQGFKIDRILSPIEYNNIMFKEFKTLFQQSQLILTGSLALHLYKSLNRYVNGIDVLCTIDEYRKITDIVVPRDYYWCDKEDSRSWGALCPYGINVLVKNKVSYEIIDNIKVSCISDIISSKISLAIDTDNMQYMNDLKEYKEYCNNLNLNYYG